MPCPEPSPIISHAESTDLEAILALQKRAYQAEAALYGGPTIQPLRQTLEQIRAEFREKTFLKAMLGSHLAGSVRIGRRGDTGLIGKLIVEPALQRRGIGTLLLSCAETALPGLTSCELFTGSRSQGNLALYLKCGYAPFSEERISDALTLVHLRKSLRPL